MEITVNVNVKAPELSAALLNLAVAMSNQQSVLSPAIRVAGAEAETVTPGKSEFSFRLPAQDPGTTEAKPEATGAAEAVKPEATKEDPKPDPAPVVTLEQVRTVMAAKSQAGKQVEVKKLLTDLGVVKLTEVPIGKYAELLKAAEAL